jgi:hypothetical protein
MSEDETASGKNSKAPKLIDAAIWIFVVTGFSIVTSVVYVFGLSRGLNFEFRIFFGIKDYLEVTPYWLGPPLSIVFVLMIFFYPLTHLKDKDVFPSKREPGQKWLPWLRYKLRARHWFLAASIALLVAAMVLTLFSRFLFSPPLALAVKDCPFDNLPATGRGLDPGLTAAEMKRCVWVKPTVVCEVKFTEWTRDDRLRHPVFLGLRDEESVRSCSGESKCSSSLSGLTGR